MTTASVLFLVVAWKTLKGDTSYLKWGETDLCHAPISVKEETIVRQFHFSGSSLMSGACGICIVQWMVL